MPQSKHMYGSEPRQGIASIQKNMRLNYSLAQFSIVGSRRARNIIAFDGESSGKAMAATAWANGVVPFWPPFSYKKWEIVGKSKVWLP